MVYRHLPGVVDLAGPRGDGSFLVAAAGRLFVLGRDGTLSPFARGAAGYRTATGTEPYLVLASSGAVRGTSCSFGNGTAFALEPGVRPGIVMICPQGRARRFASLPPGRFLSGIVFDSTGRFGHRLLVTARSGGDIGVESAGFVPPRAAAAYLADRFSAGNKHPGDNAILQLSAAELVQAGIQGGDLLIATEGGAKTIDIRCAATCTIRYVVAGPAIAHAEGHIVFAPS